MSEHPATILVVEDSPELREILTLRVKRLGNQVLSAKNGIEALELMEAHSVDLVLLDIMMPEMNGFQVLKAMKASPAFRQIPVIVISALGEMENLERCLQQGANDVLTKPFNSELLKHRIQANLKREAE